MSKTKKIFWIAILSCFLCGSSWATEKPVIVVIKSRNYTLYNNALNGFNKALREKGVAVSLLIYDIKGSKAAGLDVARKIKKKEPDLVLALGSLATEILREEIEDIPIVFSMVLNPVASGFVDSMRASDNNLTGASMDIPVRQQFENLKAVVPQVRRIGVLYTPQETGVIVAQASEIARKMGLKLVKKAVYSEKEIPEAIEELSKKTDTLWSVADSTIFSPQSTQFIILFTLRNKIPFMGLSSSFVKAGTLLALSVDEEDIGRQSGELAVQILTGREASNLPITVPRKTFLSLNLRVAEQIEIEIPSAVRQRTKYIFE